MKKKICIVTTSEEDFFTPPFLKFCLKKKKYIIDIIFLPGFFNIKKILYFLLFLRFKEIIELSVFKILKKKIEFDCNTFNFESINNNKFCSFINKKKYDLIVSYNCNQIFKKESLKKIKCNIVNFHPGILPKYRGLFTNFYSLKNSEKYVGITFHIIDSKIDNGRILKIHKIKVKKNDTIFDLYKKIFIKNSSLKFIHECILNYDKIKNNKHTSKNFFKYNSYPKFIEIIKFKFHKIK